MALFNIFKKRQLTHFEKVESAYKCYKAEAVQMLFPQGKTQAHIVIMALSKICNVDLEQKDAKEYYNLLSVYTDVLIRTVVTQSSDSLIMGSLQVKHADLVRDKCAARRVIAFCYLNMQNNSFALDTHEDTNVLDSFASNLLHNEKIIQLNGEVGTRHLDDLEYGLVLEKPIYVQGVGAANRFLSKLQTSSNEVIVWTRRCSMTAEGVNGLVDVYDSALQSGEFHKTLYINVYGATDPTVCPQGFSMVHTP